MKILIIRHGEPDYEKNTLTEKGFKEAQDSVIEGGNIARVAKEQLERKTGKKVISSKNAKEIRKLNSGV